MFKCPNCGGSMYYNIPSAKLKCRHCGSEIAPEDYGEKNDAEEQKDYEVTVYTCSNCGAELESPMTPSSATALTAGPSRCSRGAWAKP